MEAFDLPDPVPVEKVNLEVTKAFHNSPDDFGQGWLVRTRGRPSAIEETESTLAPVLEVVLLASLRLHGDGEVHVPVLGLSVTIKKYGVQHRDTSIHVSIAVARGGISLRYMRFQKSGLQVGRTDTAAPWIIVLNIKNLF